MNTLEPKVLTECSQAVQTEFISISLCHFHRIVSDSFHRLKQCGEWTPSVSEKRAPPFISKGVWYAEDYYKALNKCNQVARKEWLVNQGFTYDGYVPCGSTDPFKFVEDTKSPTKRSFYTFQLKKGYTPSTALDCLESKLSLLECKSACTLAFNRALRDILTPQKFDHLFGADSEFPLCISANEDNNSISRLMQVIQVENEDAIQEGDICYFSNIQDYIYKHPAGSLRGMNVMCQNAQKKIFLGLGMSPDGVQADDIEKALHEGFNQEPLDEGFLSPKIWKNMYSISFYCNEEKNREFVASFKEKKISFEEFQSTQSRLEQRGSPSKGKFIFGILRPNIERINQLAQASIENIRKVYSEMN